MTGIIFHLPFNPSSVLFRVREFVNQEAGSDFIHQRDFTLARHVEFGFTAIRS